MENRLIRDYLSKQGGMFSKNNKASAGANGVREARAAPSIISVNLHVIGNLKSDGEVQVDGTIDGDVSGKSLAIGERARVNGEIQAEKVVVYGVVEGKIRAKKVQLGKSAKVFGDIWNEVLSIEAGAHLVGHIKRLDQDKKSPKINLVAEPEKRKVLDGGNTPKVVSRSAGRR